VTDLCHLSDLPRDQCAHCGAAPGIAFAFISVVTLATVGLVRRSGRDVFPSAPMPTGVRRPLDFGPAHGGSCACGRVTRDAAYGCEDCADELKRTLSDAPWHAEQLEITITKQRGKTPGGGGPEGAALPWHAKGSETLHALRNHLVTAVKICVEEHMRQSSPYDGLPIDTIASMSEWLLWRVDGLMFSPAFTEILADALRAESASYWVINRLPDWIFLGPCRFVPVCAGCVYSMPGDLVGKCRSCKTEHDALAMRETLQRRLDDRLCTAAEIAELATYLGIPAARDVVRKRVNQWHSRKVIEAAAYDRDAAGKQTDPRFRYGDVAPRLAALYGRTDS
jgi:hypothetical protein